MVENPHTCFNVLFLFRYKRLWIPSRAPYFYWSLGKSGPTRQATSRKYVGMYLKIGFGTSFSSFPEFAVRIVITEKSTMILP